jgi:uncharacterized protein YndB with AHSA1/START domain
METRTITLEQTINATPERIFKALTNANELESWFPSKVSSDPKIGGSYAFTFDFPENPERNHTRTGKFTVLTPGKKVSYNWMDYTNVDFNLQPVGNGTKVSLTHAGWKNDDDANIEAHTQGWTFFLQNLKSYLETGVDQRAAAMKMQTA